MIYTLVCPNDCYETTISKRMSDPLPTRKCTECGKVLVQKIEVTPVVFNGPNWTTGSSGKIDGDLPRGYK